MKYIISALMLLSLIGCKNNQIVEVLNAAQDYGCIKMSPTKDDAKLGTYILCTKQEFDKHTNNKIKFGELTYVEKH